MHRRILRSLTKIKQSLVKEVDEVIYLLAKAQYQSKISKQVLGGDPHFAMMQEMFKSGNFEYLENIEVIRTLISKIQQLINIPVVADTQRARVGEYQKKLKRRNILSKVVGSGITLLTLGIYKLFW